MKAYSTAAIMLHAKPRFSMKSCQLHVGPNTKLAHMLVCTYYKVYVNSARHRAQTPLQSLRHEGNSSEQNEQVAQSTMSCNDAAKVPSANVMPKILLLQHSICGCCYICMYGQEGKELTGSSKGVKVIAQQWNGNRLNGK